MPQPDETMTQAPSAEDDRPAAPDPTADAGPGGAPEASSQDEASKSRARKIAELMAESIRQAGPLRFGEAMRAEEEARHRTERQMDGKLALIAEQTLGVAPGAADHTFTPFPVNVGVLRRALKTACEVGSSTTASSFMDAVLATPLAK